MEKVFETSYGMITCRYAFDPDTSLDGEGFFDMYDEDGGYYGELHTDTDDIDELTSDDIEEQIEENLYA